MSWADPDLDAVVKTLAVVCEVTGTVLSTAAQDLVVRALQAYPAAQVLGALNRCASECRFKLTLADIVSRLDDGRPGAEEAWAMFPKDEADAGVVTDEMSLAWGVAAKLYETDPIAARMAFKESYFAAVREARLQGQPARWRLTPGLNRKITESVAAEAVRAGKLPTAEIAEYVLPEHRPATLKALPSPLAYEPTQLEQNKRRLAAVLARIDGKAPEPAPSAPHWTETTERES